MKRRLSQIDNNTNKQEREGGGTRLRTIDINIENNDNNNNVDSNNDNNELSAQSIPNTTLLTALTSNAISANCTDNHKYNHNNNSIITNNNINNNTKSAFYSQLSSCVVDLPLMPELWRIIFKFVDGNGAGVFSCTCKTFLKMFDTDEDIWQSINARFAEMEGAKLQELLNDEVINKVILGMDMHVIDNTTVRGYSVPELKNEYKILSCSIVYSSRRTHEDLFAGHRKQRSFNDISEAINYACPGDFINVTGVSKFETIVIKKNLVFFGNYRIGRMFVGNIIIEDGAEVFFVSLAIKGSITVKNGTARIAGSQVLQKCSVSVGPNCSLSICQCTVQCTKWNFSPQLKSLLFDSNNSIGTGKRVDKKDMKVIWDRIVAISEPESMSYDEIKILASLFLSFTHLLYEDNVFQSEESREIPENFAEIYYKSVAKGFTQDAMLIAFRVILERLRKLELNKLLANIAKFEWTPFFLLLFKNFSEPPNPYMFSLTIKTLKVFLDCKLRKTVNVVEFLKFFVEILDSLNNTGNSRDSKEIQAFQGFVLEGIWGILSKEESMQTFMLSKAPLLIDILDKHQHSEKVLKRIFGILWNFQMAMPRDLEFQIIPRVIKATAVVTKPGNVKPIIGFLEDFIAKYSNDTSAEFLQLLKHFDLFYLLKLKDQYSTAPEVTNFVWGAIKALLNIPTHLPTILKFLGNSRLQPDDVITTLTFILLLPPLPVTLPVLRDVVFPVFKSALDTIEAPEDAIFPLGYWIQEDESLKEELVKLIPTIEQKIMEKEREDNWLPWLHMIVEGGQPPIDKLAFDPAKSHHIDISPSGNSCRIRKGVEGQFPTAITHSQFKLTTGKWYYEIQLTTPHLFQFGYVTSKFQPRPDQGEGVGDDCHSWAIDLNRHKKWHKTDDSPSGEYGTGVNWEYGGILRCYLDLDKKVMSYKYNDKNLGPAFTNFDIDDGLLIGFSGNCESVCFYNFGETPFRYGRPASYQPIICAHTPLMLGPQNDWSDSEEEELQKEQQQQQEGEEEGEEEEDGEEGEGDEVSSDDM